MNAVAPRPARLLVLLLAGCFYSPHGTPQDTLTDATDATDVSSGPGTSTSESTTTTSDGPPTGTTTVEASQSADPGGGETCVDDDGCAAPKPYCIAGACGDCLQAGEPDAACAARDPGTPVCAATGACVPCTPESPGLCQGFTPHCDPEALACVACSAHEHCPESACNLASGECLPAANVLWVDDAADCVAGTGAEATPFCTILEAIEVVETTLDENEWTIRARGTFTNFAVPEDRIVALMASGPDLARFVGTTEFSVFAVYGSTVFFDRVELTTGNALTCHGGLVWFDRSVSHKNQWAGVDVDGCITHIRQSVIEGNPVGIRAEKPGETVIVNSYVSGNGQGIELETGAALRVEFSTIVENFSDEPGAVPSLFCTAPGEVTIRNSVVMAAGEDQIDCSGAVVSHSALTPADVDGEMNLMADLISVALWFDPPKNGVYRVRPNAPLGEVGRWQPGDPTVDFDGEPRPAVADSPEWVGADRPSR